MSTTYIQRLYHYNNSLYPIENREQHNHALYVSIRKSTKKGYIQKFDSLYHTFTTSHDRISYPSSYIHRIPRPYIPVPTRFDDGIYPTCHRHQCLRADIPHGTGRLLVFNIMLVVSLHHLIISSSLNGYLLLCCWFLSLFWWYTGFSLVSVKY
jgi:hypothetical protein